MVTSIKIAHTPSTPRENISDVFCTKVFGAEIVIGLVKFVNILLAISKLLNGINFIQSFFM